MHTPLACADQPFISQNNTAPPVRTPSKLMPAMQSPNFAPPADDASAALASVLTATASRTASAAIIGSRLDEAALGRLEAAARAACRPIDDKRGTREFRIQIAGVLARRVAQIAYERAGAAS